jgi:hypothetical protein
VPTNVKNSQQKSLIKSGTLYFHHMLISSQRMHLVGQRSCQKMLLPEGFPLEKVLGAMKIIMRNNIFEFGDCYFLQLLGTAMGTSAAVMWATFYYAYHEVHSHLPCHGSSLLYFRQFIDDIFGIWVGTTLLLIGQTFAMTSINSVCWHGISSSSVLVPLWIFWTSLSALKTAELSQEPSKKILIFTCTSLRCRRTRLATLKAPSLASSAITMPKIPTTLTLCTLFAYSTAALLAMWPLGP